MRLSGWGRRFVQRRQRRRWTENPHFTAHRELARKVILARLKYWNGFYQLSFGRVAIRDQRSRWGSCSEKRNLNFSYRLIFLPETLLDYVVVHELCHLAYLHHGPDFWNEVARALPDYRERVFHLRRIRHVPKHGFASSVMRKYAPVGSVN